MHMVNELCVHCVLIVSYFALKYAHDEQDGKKYEIDVEKKEKNPIRFISCVTSVAMCNLHGKKRPKQPENELIFQDFSAERMQIALIRFVCLTSLEDSLKEDLLEGSYCVFTVYNCVLCYRAHSTQYAL